MGKLSDMLKEFLAKFKFDNDYKKTEDDRLIRFKHFQEEINEYYDAVISDDEIGQIDALCDIAYFAIGTAVMEGWDFEAHFKAVHESNMQKIRGLNPSRPENGEFDVYKPDGWVAPEDKHEQLLNHKTTGYNEVLQTTGAHESIKIR